MAGGSTLLVLLVALPAAYYTARVRFRGRKARPTGNRSPSASTT
ncbi:hypothetical protein ACWC9T_10165 [Kitasatospora sp. NPDC001159]